MENKQTAVDWLVKQIMFKTETTKDWILMSDKNIDKIIKDARFMEQERIEKSYADGFSDGQENDSADVNIPEVLAQLDRFDRIELFEEMKKSGFIDQNIVIGEDGKLKLPE